MNDSLLLPHVVWVFVHQGPVGWIYLSLILCLATRVWLSVRLISLAQVRRLAFLERTLTLSEATANIALLLGVLGTLIGVTVAISGRTGDVQPERLMETFSSAFGIAVCTTIAGGLTYIFCFLLSSLDGYLAGGK